MNKDIKKIKHCHNMWSGKDSCFHNIASLGSLSHIFLEIFYSWPFTEHRKQLF